MIAFLSQQLSGLAGDVGPHVRDRLHRGQLSYRIIESGRSIRSAAGGWVCGDCVVMILAYIGPDTLLPLATMAAAALGTLLAIGRMPLRGLARLWQYFKGNKQQ